jgi:5-formyltetrahydrofolate cyclo-ligase
MSESLSQQKAVLRTAAREQLRLLTGEARRAYSETLCQQLTSLPLWQQAKSVLLFAPRQDEPDLWPLAQVALSTGKHVALPRFVTATEIYETACVLNATTEVLPGKYGILEPAPICKVADLKQLDLVLVPGLAFDRHGYRLGRGKGFYDRLLATVSGRTCGVAFDAQLIATLPVEPHDVPLNCILTPTHWLEF